MRDELPSGPGEVVGDRRWLDAADDTHRVPVENLGPEAVGVRGLLVGSCGLSSIAGGSCLVERAATSGAYFVASRFGAGSQQLGQLGAVGLLHECLGMDGPLATDVTQGTSMCSRTAAGCRTGSQFVHVIPRVPSAVAAAAHPGDTGFDLAFPYPRLNGGSADAEHGGGFADGDPRFAVVGVMHEVMMPAASRGSASRSRCRSAGG